MSYPKIKSDILIQTDRKEFKLYTDKVLIENLITIESPVEVSVDVVSSDNTEIEDRVDRAVKVSHFGRMKVSIANQLLKIDSIEV